jgi:hypothetical protein
MSVPTARELFDKMTDENDEITSTEMMIEFAKIHVEAALKEASKKAKITERKVTLDNTGGYVRVPTIYKRYILNSYPLENIK